MAVTCVLWPYFCIGVNIARECIGFVRIVYFMSNLKFIIMKKFLLLMAVFAALFSCSKIEDDDSPALDMPQTKAYHSEWNVDLTYYIYEGMNGNTAIISDTATNYNCIDISKPYKMVFNSEGDYVKEYATSGNIQVVVGHWADSAGGIYYFQHQYVDNRYVPDDNRYSLSYEGGRVYFLFDDNPTYASRTGMVMVLYNGEMCNCFNFEQRGKNQPAATSMKVNGEERKIITLNDFIGGVYSFIVNMEPNNGYCRWTYVDGEWSEYFTISQHLSGSENMTEDGVGNRSYYYLIYKKYPPIGKYPVIITLKDKYGLKEAVIQIE